jgi:hypothetical protein
MIDKNAPNNSIPFVAYGMIGITSLVLAYATLMDTENKDEDITESGTSALPSLSPTITETQSNSVEPAEQELGMPMVPVSPIVNPPLEQLNNLNPEGNKAEDVSGLPPAPPAVKEVPVAQKVGGKSRRNKKSNKKTKRLRFNL